MSETKKRKISRWWLLWIAFLILLWICHLVIFGILTNNDKPGSTIIAVVALQQSSVGLIFIVVNIVLYMLRGILFHKHKVAKIHVGTALRNRLLLVLVLLSIIAVPFFIWKNSQYTEPLRLYTYGEILMLVDSCQIDHIEPVNGKAPEYDNKYYRIVHIKSGRSGIFETYDLDQVKSEMGYLICKGSQK